MGRGGGWVEGAPAFRYLSPPMSDPPVPRTVRLASVAVVLALLLLPGGAPAQQELPAVPVDSLALGGEAVSPGGAFLRAILVPGWGHASIGSYNRAAVYFAAETATVFGLVRTRLRLSEARERLDLQEDFRRTTLIRDGVPPDSLRLRLDEDEVLDDLRGLVEARQQQQEDWAALGIFLLLLSGADAYVSAHLKDFPTPLELDAAATPDGRMELKVGVTIPRK